MKDTITKAIREGRWFEAVILILILMFIGVIYFFIGGIQEDGSQRGSAVVVKVLEQL